MFPDIRTGLVLKLAGCWGPYNSHISHFETSFAYIFISFGRNPPPPDLSVCLDFLEQNVGVVQSKDALWIAIVPFQPGPLGCFVDSDW